MKKLFTRLAFAGALLTAATATAQTIVEENFESTTGTAVPSGWTQATAATDGGWLSGTGTGMSSSSFGIIDHTRILATNDDECNCDKSSDLLKSPTFSLTGITGAYLSFDYYYWDQVYQGDAEDFIVKVSTNGGTNWTDLETLELSNGDGNWETKYISLGAYDNAASVMIGFEYKDGGGWLYGAAIDNFKVYVPSPTDVSLVAIAPVAGSPESYNTVGNNVSFSGTIFNAGSSAITSGTITYTADGGSPVSYNLPAGTNIAPFSSYDFTITPAYSIPSLGEHNIDIAVVVSGDASSGNDEMSTVVVGASFIPNRIITFEEGTGTWCGWCPRGAVFMDSIFGAYPNTTALIAVHNADPMTLTAYDNGVSGSIGGYPSVLVDRKVEMDPSDLFLAYDQHFNDFGFANLSVTKSYDVASRNISVDVTVNPAVDLIGNYRLALVLTEDGVTGTGSTWNQTNYYSSASQNLPLQGAGHNWQTEPASVPAAQMKYDFVARYISGGYTGQSGSLPASMTSGGTYTYNLSTTLPATWNDYNMRAIVLLINVTTGQILNAATPQEVNGVNDVASQISHLSLYPNPAQDVLSLLVSLESTQNVTIDLVDVLGKTVATYDYKNVVAGTSKVNLDVTKLTSGVYFANVRTGSGMVSRKFVIE